MTNASILKAVGCLAACLALAGCGKKFNPAERRGAQAQVVETGNAALISVEKPEQFPLVTAGRVETPSRLERHRLGFS